MGVDRPSMLWFRSYISRRKQLVSVNMKNRHLRCQVFYLNGTVHLTQILCLQQECSGKKTELIYCSFRWLVFMK